MKLQDYVGLGSLCPKHILGAQMHIKGEFNCIGNDCLHNLYTLWFSY